MAEGLAATALELASSCALYYSWKVGLCEGGDSVESCPSKIKNRDVDGTTIHFIDVDILQCPCED